MNVALFFPGMYPRALAFRRCTFDETLSQNSKHIRSMSLALRIRDVTLTFPIPLYSCQETSGKIVLRRFSGFTCSVGVLEGSKRATSCTTTARRLGEPWKSFIKQREDCFCYISGRRKNPSRNCSIENTREQSGRCPFKNTLQFVF